MIRRLQIAFLFLLTLACSIPVYAQAPHPPVVLVLISGTSLGEWRNAAASPTLQRLLKSGSLAVMNVRTARSASEDAGPSAIAAAVSLTAGARCTGSLASTGLNRASAPSPYGYGTMRDILQRRTAVSAPKSSLVDASWPQLIHENSKLGYAATPGSLVSSLREAGIPTYASGGSNAFIAAMGDGYVVRGTPIATVNSLSPNTFWIVDLGSNLKNVESPLGRIVTKIDAADGTLILASLYTDQTDYKAGRRLTPLLIYGSNWPNSLLYSPSTHTAGLTILADIAPTIARCFGLPEAHFTYGRSLIEKPSSTPFDTAAEIEATANEQRASMSMLPATAIALGVLLALLALLSLHKGLRKEVWLCVPMLMLLLVVAPDQRTLVLAGALSCVLITVIGIYFGTSGTLFALCGSSMLLVLTSFAHSGWLMHRSLIGYSVIEGARYYGIGNEAMGVLFGSSLVVALLIGQSLKNKSTVPLCLLFIVVVLVLGLPSAGAKVGGVLVGIGTFGVFLLRWSGRRIRLQEGLGIAGLTIAVLAVLIAIDQHGGSSHASHLGRLWDNTQAEGATDLLSTMLRKGRVELRLLYHSCWAVALLGGLCSLILLRRKSDDRAILAFQAASVVALALTLLLNDAGVVACSLMLPYLAAGAALINYEPRAA